ncbi:MAG: DUF1579 domain-containing protein [Thermoguttaceae bacterium]|jgi:hypothetical protein|nr:DUF1579 domain-containing protein [Thermoguttaceae bacterium]
MLSRGSMNALILAGALLSWCASAVAQVPVVQPGPEHKVLHESVGTWDALVKGPDGQEKGVMTIASECGGLWIVSKFQMSMGGQTFEGRGLDGYDTAKKKYVSVWVDSMSTAPMLFEGDYDRASKSLILVGEGKGMDGKPAKFKSVTKIQDRDHHTFTIYLIGADGKEQPMMTIEYTRRK